MIATGGLSLDQAPPAHLPLRLFLTAPWFAVAAGVLLALQGETVLGSRWSPAALAATHLLTVGFLSQIMLGALLQMLPVIAGAPVPGVRLIAPAVHLLVTAGAMLLALGFLGSGGHVLAAGAISAGLGFALFALAALTALTALSRGRGGAATRRALRLTTLSLLITVSLGLTLTSALLGWLPLSNLADWVQLHVAWGLFGWIGLLILAVGMQVVPLFHVTAPYPGWMRRVLVPLMFLVLCGSTLMQAWPRFAGPAAMPALQWLLALGFSAFALATLRLQRRRSRPRLDATLLHWWSALGALLAAVLCWAMAASLELIGVLLLIGVGVGLPSGMLLKIVPFLCWFHLQSRQISLGRLQVRIPHMHRLLPERLARVHFAMHVGALLTAVIGVLEPALAWIAGLLLALSALWLFALLATAWLRYHAVMLELARVESAIQD
ncbi:MAG: hypothetical protein WBG92_24225 [Thiohalocapsa sp.]